MTQAINLLSPFITGKSIYLLPLSPPHPRGQSTGHPEWLRCQAEPQPRPCHPADHVPPPWSVSWSRRAHTRPAHKPPISHAFPGLGPCASAASTFCWEHLLRGPSCPPAHGRCPQGPDCCLQKHRLILSLHFSEYLCGLSSLPQTPWDNFLALEHHEKRS